MSHFSLYNHEPCTNLLWLLLLPHRTTRWNREKNEQWWKIGCKIVGWTIIQQWKDFKCKNVINCTTEPNHLLSPSPASGDLVNPNSAHLRASPLVEDLTLLAISSNDHLNLNVIIPWRKPSWFWFVRLSQVLSKCIGCHNGAAHWRCVTVCEPPWSKEL